MLDDILRELVERSVVEPEVVNGSLCRRYYVWPTERREVKTVNESLGKW